MDKLGQAYKLWQDDELNDGEFLDYLLDNELDEFLPSLCVYIVNTDGDYLSDRQAIHLALGVLKDINILKDNK